jgi:hypothetical protein
MLQGYTYTTQKYFVCGWQVIIFFIHFIHPKIVHCTMIFSFIQTKLLHMSPCLQYLLLSVHGLVMLRLHLSIHLSVFPSFAFPLVPYSRYLRGNLLNPFPDNLFMYPNYLNHLSSVSSNILFPTSTDA